MELICSPKYMYRRSNWSEFNVFTYSVDFPTQWRKYLFLLQICILALANRSATTHLLYSTGGAKRKKAKSLFMGVG